MATLVFVSGWGFPSAALNAISDCCRKFSGELHSESLETLSARAFHAEESLLATRLLDRYPGKVILAGWSLGGMIAAEAACMAPHRVKAFISFSSTPRFRFDKKDGLGTRLAELKALKVSLDRRSEDTLRDFYARTFGVGCFANIPESVISQEILEQWIARQELNSLREGLTYLAEKDLLTNPAKILCPVLLFHGLKDTIIAPESARLFQQIAPQVEEIFYPEATHALPMTHVQEIAKRLPDFLEGVCE